MKIERIGQPEPIMANPGSIHNYFGWPSAARLQNGKIAVACSGFRMEHVCPFGKACMALSEDDGKTFSPPAAVIDTVLDDRDAGVVPFGKSGVIVTSFNNTRRFQRESAPENAYFNAYLDQVSDAQEEAALGAEFRISTDGGVTFGEVKKSPVTSPHGPCVLPDGTLLWVGRVFNENNSFLKGEQGIRAFRITESGEMEFVGEIPDIPGLYSCEPHVAVCPDGTLICHIRTEQNFTLFQSESADGGRTWSAPHRLLPDHGGAPAHLFLHSSGVLISVYGYREFPYGIRAMLSRDFGKTWETDHLLYENTVTGDLGYPATVELKDGSLLTVFYAHPAEGEPAVIMKQQWKLV